MLKLLQGKGVVLEKWSGKTKRDFGENVRQVKLGLFVLKIWGSSSGERAQS